MDYHLKLSLVRDFIGFSTFLTIIETNVKIGIYQLYSDESEQLRLEKGA